MPRPLDNWEAFFEDELEKLDPSRRCDAGALLKLIPDRIKWDEFLGDSRAEWNIWKSDLSQYPSCLVALYGGLAFYEYDEGRFWPQFAKAIGKDSIPPNQQGEINQVYSQAANHLGFRILHTTQTYVSSAIYQIGIPLSLWDGFLEICEWAFWRDDWAALNDEEWTNAVTRRVGGRKRLKTFLLDNRESASALIKELLEARKILSENPTLSIAELAQACFLRSEYFEEVPETAEFLRPTNPESLIRDRAQLIWDEQKARIVLYVPGVKQNKLPATWCLEKLNQSASRSPDELSLNSLAFQANLNLRLVSGNRTDSQVLRGIHPWGLFDLDRGGRLVNSQRDYLPLRSYAIVSRAQVADLSRKGFDEAECPVNQRFELADNTQCFVTHLWPTGTFAEVTIGDAGQRTTLQFRTQSKIEARFFVGIGSHAANFSRLPGNEIKVENWPILCLAIPQGYYNDNDVILNEKFMVFIDEKPALGRWDAREVCLDDGKDFYVWDWNKHPLRYEKTKAGTVKGFRQLADFYRPPVLHGKMTLSVQAPGFSERYHIYKDDPKPGMDKCWRDLPGAYLPWFLLCQTQEGMKWEEVLFARDIIAPSLRLSAYLLRKYEKEGFFVQKGVRWKIAESRATVSGAENNNCRLDYCGDPSVLWRFYRWMSRPGIGLPKVEVVNKRGEVPYLRMNWNAHLHDEIIHRLQRMNVRIGPSLWNH